MTLEGVSQGKQRRVVTKGTRDLEKWTVANMQIASSQMPRSNI
jgi:hypothetical protein